ncbi:MAG: exopolysaccharide biosynthesis polyprenyl glycosylphosphotransferase, partial [Acidobacteriota bacterium]
QVFFACTLAATDILALLAGYKISGPNGLSDDYPTRRLLAGCYGAAYLLGASAAGLYRRPCTAGASPLMQRSLNGHGVALAILAVPLLYLHGVTRTADLLISFSVVFLPALLVGRGGTLLTRELLLLRNGWMLERVRTFLAKHWQVIFACFVAAVDIAALFAGYKISGPTAISDYHVARRVISVWYVGSYFLLVGAAGLYRRPYTASVRSQLRRCLKGHFFVLVALSAPMLFLFGIKTTAELLITLSLIFVPALLAARALTLVLREVLLARGWFLDRAVVLLDEAEGDEVPFWLSHIRRVGYDVATIVRCHSVFGLSVSELATHIEGTGAGCLIVPSPRYIGDAFHPVIEYARNAGLTIRIFSPEVQRVLSTAKVDDVPGVTIEAPVGKGTVALQLGLKRAFDVVAASTILVLTSPILAMVAIAIRLESPGPLLFRQPRSSAPGKREFLALKFRSMTVDSAERRLHLAAANQTSGALFKIRNDPRVTRVGKFIRKFSIDELPQLWNIVRGEMSLVGPRPLPTDDFSMVVGSEIDGCYHRRAWVRPGLTGLWQISGRSDLGFVDMVMLDLYYAEHGTAFLDLWILLNTVPVVLFGKGAY